MLRAILVDDMPSALELLESDIQSNSFDIEVVGTAKSVVEAAKLLRKNTQLIKQNNIYIQIKSV